MTRSLRFGLMGAAEITPKAFVEPSAELVQLSAIAARDPGRAQAFARLHGIERSVASYDALVDDPDLDALYIALPAALHVPWAERALRTGKHVLVEKPATLAEADAARLVVLARERGLVFAEAHHSDYHPLLPVFRAALSALGEVESTLVVFDAPISAGNIRRDVRLGAGVLTDFGGYLVRWSRWVYGWDFAFSKAHAVTAETEVDEIFAASGRGGAGGRLTLSSSMEPTVPFRAFIEVRGARGRVRFENPLSLVGSELHVEVGGRSAVTFPSAKTTFRGQLEAFVEACRGGAPVVVSGEELILTQRTLDGLYRLAGLAPRVDLTR